jgi:N-acetylmuramoyl-L-alanine amidase
MPTNDDRSASSRDRSKRRTRTALVVAGSLVLVIAFVVGGWALYSRRSFAPATPDAAAAQSALASDAVQPSAESTAGVVEVPSLVGLNLDQAMLVLQTAGLTVAVSSEGTPTAGPRMVSLQEPEAGGLAEAGSKVRIVVPPAASASSSKKGGGASKKTFVVCIDPGHQAHSDTSLEAVGPGSAEQKPKVSGGATGAFTKVPEFELALQIATNLQNRLQQEGLTVVMTRTTNDVNVSNAQRAEVANSAHADLFVRIHADGSTDENLSGVSTLYPASNPWTKPIAGESHRAAVAIQSGLVSATGAVDRGAIESADLAGFNWAKVPSVLVETGFLTNRVEDRLLASPHYQDELAQGIADGILTYSTGRR